MKQPNTLDNAPEHIKLAVDLIMLLEQNKIDPNTALQALEIVKNDLEKRAHPPQCE
ncbi:pleiotropic regulatory protein RsmS [Flocculibacter collagenilyticus]|uniref:pleiotropic regulatory protein RsmS n=1 Tax=Flocculibacter collagenilyticus TaxID=2744479 RepID=UPI0018F2843D|nr:pleiotropic regulatory protein RsmS [Flocculibacter collagenilyticus]